MLNQNISEEAIMEVVKKVLGDLELTEEMQADTPLAGDESLTDIAMIPEEEICLVENPRNKEALMRLKRSTPARTATGRTGDREKTIITIRKMANLSAAVDAVWTPLNREFVSSLGYPVLKSMSQSKEEYLMRPDLGVILDNENMNLVRTQLQKNPDVQLIIGEGQSNQGLEKSMPELLPALLQGLQSNKINYGTPCFVEYTRVGIRRSDWPGGGRKGSLCDSGREAGPAFLGRTWMLYHLCTKGRNLRTKRTCVSNIQDNGGTPPAEAGAYIADLIARILKEGKSGVDLII